MANEKTQEIREYEVNYIIDPQLDEKKREALDQSIDEKIAELSGKIEHNSPTIRKKLAYPLDGKYSVFFRSMHISLPAEQVNSLRAMMQKDTNILRVRTLQTAWREPVSADDLFAPAKKEKETDDAETTPKKEVTKEAVEEGIEKALTEEVK